tara:strand:- start:34629 stop:36524 length:1896 start_codon:yes stop_codon:yes gene_type:complete
MVPVGRLAYRTGQNEYINRRRRELESLREQQADRQQRAAMHISDINASFQRLSMENQNRQAAAQQQQQFQMDFAQQQNQFAKKAAKRGHRWDQQDAQQQHEWQQQAIEQQQQFAMEQAEKKNDWDIQHQQRAFDNSMAVAKYGDEAAISRMEAQWAHENDVIAKSALQAEKQWLQQRTFGMLLPEKRAEVVSIRQQIVDTKNSTELSETQQEEALREFNGQINEILQATPASNPEFFHGSHLQPGYSGPDPMNPGYWINNIEKADGSFEQVRSFDLQKDDGTLYSSPLEMQKARGLAGVENIDGQNILNTPNPDGSFNQQILDSDAQIENAGIDSKTKLLDAQNRASELRQQENAAGILRRDTVDQGFDAMPWDPGQPGIDAKGNIIPNSGFDPTKGTKRGQTRSQYREERDVATGVRTGDSQTPTRLLPGVRNPSVDQMHQAAEEQGIKPGELIEIDVDGSPQTRTYQGRINKEESILQGGAPAAGHILQAMEQGVGGGDYEQAFTGLGAFASEAVRSQQPGDLAAFFQQIPGGDVTAKEIASMPKAKYIDFVTRLIDQNQFGDEVRRKFLRQAVHGNRKLTAGGEPVQPVPATPEEQAAAKEARMQRHLDEQRKKESDPIGGGVSFAPF